MITRVSADIQKVRALAKMARITKERLEKTDMLAYPSNTLVDYYDILHKLVEALALLKGIKVKGEGAHRELIEYICREYGFNEQTRVFLQQLREYRNRISYEGFMIQEFYIKSNQEKLNLLISDLLKKLD